MPATTPGEPSGLEWETSSPPPIENFDTPPVVTWEAYEYHESTATHSLPPKKMEAARVH